MKRIDLQTYEKDYKNNLTIDRPKGYIHIDEIYQRIAGHSDYHGDAILAAFTCLAEGKEIGQVRPLDFADRPNNKIHLCNSCQHNYPACPAEQNDVIFGGNDNICCCAKYETAQQWTSVIYPPKEYGWYLTQTVRGVIDKQYYGVHKEKDKSLIGWGDTDMGEYPHYSHHHPKNKVIAWMPLPKPYIEDGE